MEIIRECCLLEWFSYLFILMLLFNFYIWEFDLFCAVLESFIMTTFGHQHVIFRTSLTKLSKCRDKNKYIKSFLTDTSKNVLGTFRERNSIIQWYYTVFLGCPYSPNATHVQSNTHRLLKCNLDSFSFFEINFWRFIPIFLSSV